MTRPIPDPAPPTRSRASNARWVLMLGSLAALPAITTDMYLPSLPAVASDLGTSTTAAQLTMSGMLLGGAVGQLVIGPFSDRYGRRLPVIVGIVLHVITSLLCSVAPTIEALVALRVVQGFFNAAAAVVAIAVIRDRFVGSAAARLLSQLMLVIGVAPLFAPTIGQVVAGQWQWRAVFYVLALVGVVLALVVWRWLPETLPTERRRIAGPKGVVVGYAQLVRDRHFIALAVLPGLGMAVIMSYVVGSPFVLQEDYGLSPAQFAGVFALNGVALVASAQLNAALVRRVAPVRILRVALVVQLVFAAFLVVVLVTGLGGVVGVVVALWLVLGMQGMIPANASVLALGGYGHMAGTAAALIGALQAGVAGLVSPLVGAFGGHGAAMGGVMIASIAVAVAVLAIATPAYRKGGWHTMENRAAPPPR
ncbi:multidrug effflux MFS transporter [Sanguibacter suaedae]|uniref:multidrug effflux MFS transporter n=1 Tax=Sanguibacter suaedae TaxID=2795737 RepID=UPI0027DE0E70|nr:multidrug effflux MFS transporter [Sanguibacter suaedae]